MEQNEKEEIVDERATIKKKNLDTIYLFFAISLLIQFFFPSTEQQSSIRTGIITLVARNLGSALALCFFPLIFAFLISWKKGIYYENFRIIFIITWIFFFLLFLAGKFL